MGWGGSIRYRGPGVSLRQSSVSATPSPDWICMFAYVLENKVRLWGGRLTSVTVLRVVSCIPALREHNQRAAEAARLRGALPAGAGRVSAGGRRHGDTTLPVRGAGHPGLLPAGRCCWGGREWRVLVWTSSLQFVCFVVE